MAARESTDQPTPRTRSPRELRLLGQGREPDPRFSLANERTFLAWIRTALAFMGGAVALEAFSADIFPDTTRTVLAVLLLAIAVVLAGGAAARWLRVERAMRRGDPLPLSGIAPVVGLTAAVAAAVLVMLVLLR